MSKNKNNSDIKEVVIPMRVTSFLLQPDGSEYLQAVAINRGGHIQLPVGTTEKQSLAVNSTINVTISSREPITEEEKANAVPPTPAAEMTAIADAAPVASVTAPLDAPQPPAEDNAPKAEKKAKATKRAKKAGKAKK